MTDLTGRWSGMFSYPALLPPNSFEATLRDSGGLISGITTEADDDPFGSGATLHAVIEGRREGNSVTFSKSYDDLGRAPFAILYRGTVHPDGDEIEGRWEIPGIWAGTFLMVRHAGVSEAAERRVSEQV